MDLAHVTANWQFGKMFNTALQSLFDALQRLRTESSLTLLNLDHAVLDDPATTLEYVDRYRYWQTLDNIVASIPDLLRQDDQIALVGFLGHFSSGKSSLINALMGIGEGESPGYRRAVGTHPTDIEITLITHRDHAELVKKSSYTVVEEINVVHGPAIELLEHATLVDTPGLGNEVQGQDIVTRFLHLCHVLVMTIDGRRPFADKDKDFDLLDTAFNKLSGVPKLLAITSAEEFLDSRRGDFATDWNEGEATAFWAETIRRLKTDPRFAQHIVEFEDARRFFVDSKERFNVDKLSAALLRIVADDAHRSRIRKAQARYVLDVALESLLVLHRYISSRSENLKRLQTEAQNRADKTKTALDELLQSLETEFSQIRATMQDVKERMPDLQFALVKIATPDAISPLHKRALERLAGQIQGNVAAHVRENTGSLEALAVTAHRAATPWWRASNSKSGEVNVDAADILRASIPHEELAQAAIECGVDLFSEVNEQLRQKRREALKHLKSRRERASIGSRVRDIDDALDQFEQIHNDAVRGFLAYVTQPSSRDLLKEHGFVGFDETGDRAVEPQSLDMGKIAGVCAIRNAAEECKDSLKALTDGEDSDYELLLAGMEEEETLEETTITETFPGTVETKVVAECRVSFANFQTELNSHIEKLRGEFQEAKSEKAQRVVAIWKARGTLLARFILVVLLVVLAGAGVEAVWEGSLAALRDLLPGGTRTTVVTSIVSSLAIMAIVFVVSGVKNPTVAAAIGSTMRARVKVYTTRRRQTKALRSHVRGAVDTLARKMSGTDLNLEPMIVTAAIRWLSESPPYKMARQELSGLEERVRRRTECLDEFSRIANENMALIPDELRESAENIRRDAVERHMIRIREVTDAVDNLRSDLAGMLETVR